MLAIVSVVVLPAVAGACPRELPLSGTFLQPTRDVRARMGEWNALFADIARLGMTDIYLQWSAADGVYEDGEVTWPEDPTPFVREALDRADASGLRVWVGLSYAGTWWDRIDRDRPLESVEVYLRRRLFLNTDVARRVADVVRDHSAFAGWYIPEEIDDKNWIEPERRAAIARYVHDLSARLRAFAPGRPVAISGFATGFAAPATLGEQWSALVADEGVDLVLLQDGIGAGHLEESELAIIVPGVRKGVDEAGGKLGIVVELFESTSPDAKSPGAFAAEPASLDRIRRQVDVAERLGTEPRVAFSVSDYMSPFAGARSGALYDQYLRWERGCGFAR